MPMRHARAKARELGLTGWVRTTPGFEQTLVFWVPDGFTLDVARVHGLSSVDVGFSGEHALVLSFTGVDGDEHGFDLLFE